MSENCPDAETCKGQCDDHRCIDDCCGGGCETCLSICPGWHG